QDPHGAESDAARWPEQLVAAGVDEEGGELVEALGGELRHDALAVQQADRPGSSGGQCDLSFLQAGGLEALEVIVGLEPPRRCLDLGREGGENQHEPGGAPRIELEPGPWGLRSSRSVDQDARLVLYMASKCLDDVLRQPSRLGGRYRSAARVLAEQVERTVDQVDRQVAAVQQEPPDRFVDPGKGAASGPPEGEEICRIIDVTEMLAQELEIAVQRVRGNSTVGQDRCDVPECPFAEHHVLE